jgi:hypothetical protein
LPEDAVTLGVATTGRTATYAPVRRERALARAGEKGARLFDRLARRRSEGGEWDAERTARRLVAPLLAHLGYRGGKEAVRAVRQERGSVPYRLRVGGSTAIALDVRRLVHDLDDDDAWSALGRAQAEGAPYAAVTNGREVRLYAASIAEAQDSAVAARVLTLSLVPVAPGEAVPRADQAALWLLSRDAVAGGALDAYTTDRLVGRALLSALDVPDSPLAAALVAAVEEQGGVALPRELVLRHARLAVRGRRGRDGEPLAEDVATVAAVRGPRLDAERPAEAAPAEVAAGDGSEVASVAYADAV